MLTRDDIKRLAAAKASPAVSIFLPLHATSREVRQDPARLRNLCAEAERRLLDRGRRKAEAQKILAPALGLAGDDDEFRQGGTAMALFLAPGFFRCERVPLELAEAVDVGARFCVKPLLPLLGPESPFVIVAISAARARVFAVAGDRIEEVSDLRLPQGMETVAQESDYENTALAHPTAGRHQGREQGGMGLASNAGQDPEELRRAQYIEYLRRVANAVEPYLSGRHVPVVLAGLPAAQGHFRAIARIETLLPEGIDINPDAVSPELLRERARALVQPAVDAQYKDALEQLRNLVGSDDGRASTRIDDILKAAHYGRVSRLFIADRQAVWGRFDEGADKVELHHQTREPGDEELLDRAAAETIVNGGDVMVLPAEELPGRGFAAALMRY